MAKASRPLFSESASGSLGGLTYSSHRGTNVIKRKCSPKRPSTASQLFHQQLMTQISQAWSGLSADQRHQWDSLSSNNKSGYTVFSERNYIRSMAYGYFNLLSDPVVCYFGNDWFYDWFYDMDGVYFDSGFWMNRPWFIESRISFANYEGKKLSPKQCKTSRIIPVFPPDITNVFSPVYEGFAILYFRFIDGQSGCVTDWQRREFSITDLSEMLVSIGGDTDVKSLIELRDIRRQDSERLLQLHQAELPATESI